LRKCFFLVIAMMALAIVGTGMAAAASSITYTGQGMSATGPTTSKCDAGDAGSTGQTIPADGRYLLWVLNGNSVVGPVTLTLPDGPHQMIKVGGTWKFVSQPFTKAQLTALPAKATFTSGTANNLVVSHGCVRVPSHVTTTIHAGLDDADGVRTPTGNLGSAVHDSAQVTVDNNVDIPAGSTVTFKWYKGDTLVDTSLPQHVGANGSVDPALPKGPLHAGDYHYTASFTSGRPDLVGSSVAADEPLHINQGQLKLTTQIHGVNGEHGNVGDAVSVPLGSTVHDTATITGQVDGIDAPGAGDVSFTLNDDPVGNSVDADAPATIRSDESLGLAAGSYTYKAHVNGNDDYLAADSADEPLTVDKAQLTIETAIHNDAHGTILSAVEGSVVHDTATVTGAVPGFDPTGAVSFTLNGDPVATDASTDPDPIRTVDSDPLVLNTSYTYQASVAEDDNYFGDDSPTEPLTVTAKESFFCSPGFWKNGSDEVWALVAPITRDSLFNNTVVSGFYDTQFSATNPLRVNGSPNGAIVSTNPTLQQVLDNSGGANTNSGPFGLSQYNATGAFLTNAAGLHNSGTDVENCPIDAHGSLK
jgi:hypothetical protein